VLPQEKPGQGQVYIK